MDSVPERVSFPHAEEETLAYWEKIDAFQTSGRRHEGLPEYSFYDGPPFATGTPHYGHILAGTIKDTVTRYAHMNGFHVVRRFGWDTHGLPIEFEIDKLLGVRRREQVLEMGIDKYNDACRGIVMRFSEEWRKTVSRLGRWIDFDNDYKTLDTDYMESVWWVFHELWEKGFVYRGFKVMPYSYACTTPLSNFEAGSNYKDKSDPFIYVTFPLVEDPEVELVAMTTTPWTLPSNLALCVNANMDYVKVKDKKSGRQYVLLKSQLSELYKSTEDGNLFHILDKFKGSVLQGKRYQPIFGYFAHMAETGAFRVLVDDYVKEDSGTGIVHQAPAFGVDDNRVCEANGVITKGGELPLPLDLNCRFTGKVPDFEGQLVFDANPAIIADLKKRQRLVKQTSKVHKYPYCWRSDTPLVYRGVPCWFIHVEKVRDKLLKNQDQTYWVPQSIAKRFVNWLSSACDWAVSRNRFFGTPIPIWTNEDNTEFVCIESIEKLHKLSGVKVTDLHREFVDPITIPSKDGKGVLRRVEEVMDCWFESGSMPYAQVHYPFENKELFENSFPADFIAEGVDQTRGWFYTLMVLSTILFDKPAFKNLIANGMVLAADGKKMSKRLKNYPDPNDVIHSYGADTLRLYLINSPVVHAEDLKFKEEGVNNVRKDVLIPWFHAYRFIVSSVNSVKGFKPDLNKCLESTNILDKWILAATQNLVKFVEEEMAAYRLYTVVPALVKFIEQLTNWYLKFNRSRLKGSDGELSQLYALNTSYEVMLTMAVMMAPFTPFLSEYFYQNLRKLLPPEEAPGPLKDFHVNSDSVHYLPVPKFRQELLNDEVVATVSVLQQAVEMARSLRERNTLPLKQPLSKLTVILQSEANAKRLENVKSYIKSQTKVKEVVLSNDASSVVAELQPDSRALGKRLRGDRAKVEKALKEFTDKEVRDFLDRGSVDVFGHTITTEDAAVVFKLKDGGGKIATDANKDMVVVLDIEVTQELKEEFFVNQAVNYIQKLRKKCYVNPTDPSEVFFRSTPDMEAFLAKATPKICSAVSIPFLPFADKPKLSFPVDTSDGVIDNHPITFALLLRPACVLLEKESEETIAALEGFLHLRNVDLLTNELKANNGVVEIAYEGRLFSLKHGESLFFSAQARADARASR